MSTYSAFEAIKKLEIDTLRRVTDISEFGRLGELQYSARAALTSTNQFRGPVDINLGFTLDIRLRGDRKREPVSRRLDIGALVEPTPNHKSVLNASYSLLICRRAETPSPIVRKLHFDYEPIECRNLAEPKPSAHMQVCGRLSRHHLAAGHVANRLNGLYPDWEKPRIPLAPMSLALMLNWLLLEFQGDPASQGILNSPRWRNWVAEAERTVLLPYFKSASAFLTSTADIKNRFLQRHLYGMAAG